MIFKQKEAKTCATLLREYQQSKTTVRSSEKLTFIGVGDKDVYNITAPFEDEGEPVIAGRVESRDSEYSEIIFFVERNGTWIPREGAPVFALQDPFHTEIAGELVFGGVQIYPHPNLTKEHIFSWRTVFYKGNTIAELKPFFTGPCGMKDLRLVELIDGNIGVFTRPQGEKGGRGKIGFTRISSLNDLTLEVIDEAPLLEGQFIDEDWGGGNEIHLLNNGLLGILGHFACYDTKLNRHYYSMVFVLDPETCEFSDIRLIAVRDEFLPGVSKRPDLKDIVFSGGLVRNSDGTANLYVGLSDAEAHHMTMADPFIPFE